MFLRDLFNEKKDRKGHNDLDYFCKYWWGDRSGSLSARCPLCNPHNKET